MINPALPLELDDGTPVTFVRTNLAGDWIQIRTPAYGRVNRSSTLRGSGIYWYNSKTGVFYGGTERPYKLLRNVDETDLYERDLEQ